MEKPHCRLAWGFFNLYYHHSRLGVSARPFWVGLFWGCVVMGTVGFGRRGQPGGRSRLAFLAANLKAKPWFPSGATAMAEAVEVSSDSVAPPYPTLRMEPREDGAHGGGGSEALG